MNKAKWWADRDWPVICARVLFVIACIVIWETAAGGPSSLLPVIVLSRPSSVAATTWHLLLDGQLLSALGATGLSVLYSLALGAVIGSALAVLTSVPVGRWLLEPLINVTYAVPKVALIPLYIILLGLNTRAHVALVTSAVLFVYYYAVRQAIGEVDRDQLTALRLLDAGWAKIATALYFRSSVPQLLAATRIALPLAFATEIFAELQVPTTSGLGVLMEAFDQTGLSTLDASGVIAVMLFVVLVAYLLDAVIGGRLRHYTIAMGVGADQ